jgi:drug/metabolite transporter (DMT)-like permease
MKMHYAALIFCCVVLISAGQLLFKKVSMEIEKVHDLHSIDVLAPLALALIAYGLATLLWIFLLRFVRLNIAYTFMALSFVMVPFGSYVLFREPLTAGFFWGTTLVVSGLMINFIF